ncbi:MAG: protein TolR [Deltaproteobacteria bacterium]|nr:protein TolR [Deltaproteobacteria bacterium]
MKLHANNGVHHRSMAEINITPFVDVVLVLLIIFMITAPMLQQGMSVQLPKAQAPEVKRTPQDLILTIDGQGHVFIGDSRSPVPQNELATKLAAVYQGKESKDLLIKADQQLRYGQVIGIMSEAQKAGVERIGMITQPDK